MYFVCLKVIVSVTFFFFFFFFYNSLTSYKETDTPDMMHPAGLLQDFITSVPAQHPAIKAHLSDLNLRPVGCNCVVAGRRLSLLRFNKS